MWFFPPGHSSVTLFLAAVRQWPLYNCERERVKNEQCFLSCSHVGRQCPRSSCPPLFSVVSRCCVANAVVRERVASKSEIVRCSRERASNVLSAASFFMGLPHRRIILSRSISQRVNISPVDLRRRDSAFARTPPHVGNELLCRIFTSPQNSISSYLSASEFLS